MILKIEIDHATHEDLKRCFKRTQEAEPEEGWYWQWFLRYVIDNGLQDAWTSLPDRETEGEDND